MRFSKIWSEHQLADSEEILSEEMKSIDAEYQREECQ